MATLYEKEFSIAVAKLIKGGYTIAAHPMGGSQGEIAKVCFEKDGKYFALYLTNEFNDNGPTRDNPGDKVHMIMGAANGKYDYPGAIMWLKDLVEVTHRIFYIVGGYGRKSAFITEDRDAAWEAARKGA